MAAWRAGSSCRPTAGRAAIAPACMARSTRRGWPRWPRASPSRASHYGAIRGRGSTASSAPTPGSTIALTEGKNREVRRVLAHLDLPVMRLIRVAFGPFHLGELRARRRSTRCRRRRCASCSASSAPRKEGWAKPRRKPDDAQAAAALMLKIVGGKHRGRSIATPEGDDDAADRQPRARGAVQHPGACQLARRRHLAADRRARARRLRRLRRARPRGAVARRRARDLPRQRRRRRSG